FDIRILASVGSVIICLVVFLLSLKHTKRLKKVHRGQQWISDFEQRQRRLTATMCVACAFTLFLYVIPVCIDLSLGGTTDVLTSNILSIYTAISTNLSPFTNIVVIAMRHLDI
ncbi:hypothetical protein Tcan_00406, partial [Toxocara canis]